MRHWNRGRKTVRNFLVALLLLFLLYASQGFPPYTVGGMCRQMRHDYLLEELEPLYVQRHRVRFSGGKSVRYTTVAARSGETYTIFRYQDGLLGSRRDWSDLSPVFGEGAVATARAGTIYAAGPFAEAASAVAVVRAEKDPEPNGKVRSREFALAGTRLADQVFAFPYEMNRHSLADEEPDYRELSLTELVDLWYRRMVQGEGPGTYFLRDGELPCTVTLYGESGETLETFSLAVTAEGIRSWW